jgi:FHA domain
MTLTLPILRAPPPARVALTLALGIAVAVCSLILLAAVGVLVVMAIRRARRGQHLDRILLRLHLARSRTWPTSRLGRLERRVVWGTLAGAILDPSRQLVWLPDTLEVFLAPGDFHALERAALRLQRRVLERLHAVATVGPCRFQAQPIVVFAEDMAGRPGRPTLRVSFAEATEQAGPPVGDRREQTPTSNVSVLRHAYLQPLQPQGPPRRLQVGRPFFIGRLPSCDLVLDQPAISRRHAVIYQRDGVWYIADAGSSNGTYVNLTPTAEPVRLLDGDEIRLGGSVSLRFELRSQRHRLR